MVGRVLAEVARSFANFRLVATREAELLHEFSASHERDRHGSLSPGTRHRLARSLDVGAKIWGDEVAVAAGGAALRAVSRSRSSHGSGRGSQSGTSMVRDDRSVGRGRQDSFEESLDRDAGS